MEGCRTGFKRGSIVGTFRRGSIVGTFRRGSIVGAFRTGRDGEEYCGGGEEEGGGGGGGEEGSGSGVGNIIVESVPIVDIVERVVGIVVDIVGGSVTIGALGMVKL